MRGGRTKHEVPRHVAMCSDPRMARAYACTPLLPGWPVSECGRWTETAGGQCVDAHNVRSRRRSSNSAGSRVIGRRESETVCISQSVSCAYPHHPTRVTHPSNRTASRGVCAFLLFQVYNPLLLLGLPLRSLHSPHPHHYHPHTDDFGYQPLHGISSPTSIRQAVETNRTDIFILLLRVHL